MLYKQMESTKDAYQAYSKNIRAAGGKRMNFVDFNEAVGMAMRRGDQSDIPEVAQAAAQIRPMFEATKVRMQELGICQRMSTYQRHKVTCLAFISSTKFSLIALNSESALPTGFRASVQRCGCCQRAH